MTFKLKGYSPMRRSLVALACVGAVLSWIGLTCAAMAQQVGTPMVPTTPSFTGFSLLAKSGTASSHTGDTNESILATIAVPANAIGANGQIRINSW